MDRWEGKTALVTGVGSGIGRAIAEGLVTKGLTVVGIDKISERLSEVESSLAGKKGKLIPIKADLLNEDEIVNAFDWVGRTLGAIHVLVNNAGVLNMSSLLKAENTNATRDQFAVNVLAVLTCSRLGIKSMLKHGVDDGHIINLSSVSAHLSLPITGFSSYMATKKAMSFLSEGLRSELGQLKSNIRITVLSPGVVYTDMLNFAKMKEDDIVCMKVNDVVRAVIFALEQPSEVLVQDIIIRNVKENKKRAEKSIMDYVREAL